MFVWLYPFTHKEGSIRLGQGNYIIVGLSKECVKMMMCNGQGDGGNGSNGRLMGGGGGGQWE